MRGLYKRDPFVNAWDLNKSCRNFLIIKKGSKKLFARLKKYARKRQRADMKQEMRREIYGNY